MKCKQCHKELITWLEGSASQEKREAVEAHLAVCAGCREFAVYLRETLALAAAEVKVEEDPWFYTRVKARLTWKTQTTAPPARGKSSGHALAGLLQPAFFTLLLLLGIYGGIRLGGAPHRQNHPPLITEAPVPWMDEMNAEPLETFLMQ